MASASSSRCFRFSMMGSRKSFWIFHFMSIVTRLTSGGSSENSTFRRGIFKGFSDCSWKLIYLQTYFSSQIGSSKLFNALNTVSSLLTSFHTCSTPFFFFPLSFSLSLSSPSPISQSLSYIAFLYIIAFSKFNNVSYAHGLYFQSASYNGVLK